MAATESRSYCRVAIVAPSTRIDLALPVDVPVIDLLPTLLDYAGEARDDGGGTTGGWQLTRVGHGELDGGRTLRSLDIDDGEILRLFPREDPTPPPLFDDIIDAVATTSRSGINARSSNPGIGAAAIAGALFVAAIALFLRGRDTADAYVAGGVALASLGLGTATSLGANNRVIATSLAAAGIPFAFLTGLIAVPGSFGHWGTMLGALLVFAYSIAAIVALGTGVATLSAGATAGLLVAIGALIAGLSHEHALHIVAGESAVAVGALAFLPRIAIRLARLPLGTVPTTAADLAATDDVGDIDEVTAKARVASEYLLGTIIGCAVVVAATSAVLAAHRSALSIALAACALLAMAMRARLQPTLGARAGLLAAVLASGLVSGLVLALLHQGAGHRFVIGAGPDSDRKWLLGVALGVGALAMLMSAVLPRMRVSPQARRLVDLFESLLMIAVLPLAVGVIGLYSKLRHL